MKEVTVMDDRGRITLGKKIAKKYGRKFVVVPAMDEIVLMPVPQDPITDLQKMWKEAGLNKYTRKQIKKMAEEEAEKEALEGWKRGQRIHRR